MKAIQRKVLEQVLDASSEPIMIVRLDHTDWPVAYANPACAAIGSRGAVQKPFAEVIEALVGRETAVEISESFRSRQETSFPVEAGGNEFLLTLKLLSVSNEDSARYCAVFWRSGSGKGGAMRSDSHHALISAKRKIRDLARDDPVTGLLNGRAFREVLEHDWAVASREKSTLALVLFRLDDFDVYVDVFGRHASDSCLRRVGQAIRRCLRRASDVVAALDSSQLIVLSHASDEEGVRNFAKKIALAVRDLGMHHPRSTKGRFVTVTQRVAVTTAGREFQSAGAFLDSILDDASISD